jgi:phosphatidylinositol glycan class W
MPFLVSWIVLLLPLLLSMTLFANKPLLLSFLLLVPTGLILLRTPHPSSAIMPIPTHGRNPSPVPGSNPSRLAEEVKSGSLRPLPTLTTYRAHMMLMTILGILAVDFPVFPRALAKCESYGVSLVRFIVYHSRRDLSSHAWFPRWISEWAPSCSPTA